MLDVLADFLGRVFGWWWLQRYVQRADLTAVDFLVRASLAFGAFVVFIWLALRFN
jgi:hypothetical protein